MAALFDFDTDEVLEWEVEAIWAALDADEIVVSRHAQHEANLDALTDDDIFDTIALYESASKDRPGNVLGRAPGINFERALTRHRRVLVKVGGRGDAYYVIVTAMVL